MTEDDDLLEDPSVRRAYKDGGVDALVKAWADLYRKDLDQFNSVACAFDPGHMRRIRNAVENAGYTFQELIELAKKKQQRKGEPSGWAATLRRQDSAASRHSRRNDFLDMERRWLALARSIGFSERLDSFSKNRPKPDL